MELEFKTVDFSNRRLKLSLPRRIFDLGSDWSALRDSGLFRSFFIAYGKLVPPLGTPALEYIPAVSRAHSLAKSVLVGSLTLAWLIGTFHDLTFLGDNRFKLVFLIDPKNKKNYHKTESILALQVKE